MQALATLRKQYDHLASQQSHWDALHRASQEIETIASLFQHANSEETNELKRIRDGSQALENEHAALKKRFKDQESKIANSERALATAKQSLATANQRSAEWERRAKESEGKYELVQTQLDQLEQTQSQLEADHSLTVSRLEDKEAEERLYQVERRLCLIVPLLTLPRTVKVDCWNKFLLLKVVSTVCKPKSIECVPNRQQPRQTIAGQRQTVANLASLPAPRIMGPPKQWSHPVREATHHRFMVACGIRCMPPDPCQQAMLLRFLLCPNQDNPIELTTVRQAHRVPPLVW
jgi:hypothetical protein